MKGRHMKCSITRTGIAIGFAMAMIVSMASPAQAGGPPCSLARAAGNWAFTDNGTVVGIGLRATVGTFTLDAAGNVLNGVATSSLNGSVADETFSGTYTVKNAHCTGTMSLTFYDTSANEILTVTLNLAFDDKMDELRGLFTSATLPNNTPLPTVITLDARQQ